MRDRAAIVGIGATEFSKNSGRSEVSMAVEAVQAALDDCGLRGATIDGMVTFATEETLEFQVANCLGVEQLSLYSRVPYGGDAGAACLQEAAIAVASGVAEVVVVYRSINGRSGLRYSRAMPLHGSEAASAIGLNGPFGLLMPAQFMAMHARRYMHDSGATSEDFGRVAVVLRSNASTNPAAIFFGKPITLAEHQASKWISEPIRLLDCCLETDGAQALIVTSAERARDLRHTPAVIRAASQGMVCPQQLGTSWSRDRVTGMEEMLHVARRIYTKAGIGPDDIQAAILYDHFTPVVLMQLEAFGFCDRGEAPDFVRDGNIELDGRLPVNPHGGMIGEAYIHGMNNIAEGVRQLRGTSSNQVQGVEHILVTSGGGGPSSGAILGRDSG